MTPLNKNDMIWILRRLPNTVFGLLKTNKTLFLAGGFIRSIIANETVNDIDIFAPSKEEARKAAALIAGNNKVHETDNAFTVKLGNGWPIVQFIHRWVFDSPEKCIASFDFTVACAAIWFDDVWKSIADDDFYADLSAKRLIYRSPVRNEDAGGSMLRVLKFYQRGYRIPLDSLGAVIARLVKGVNDEVIEKAMKAHGKTEEQAMAFVLTGFLREVDPVIDPDNIAHLPSSNEPVETQPEDAKGTK